MSAGKRPRSTREIRRLPPITTGPLKPQDSISLEETGGDSQDSLSYRPSNDSEILPRLSNEQRSKHRSSPGNSDLTSKLKSQPADCSHSRKISRFKPPEEERLSNRSPVPSIVSNSGHSRNSSTSTLDNHSSLDETKLADAIVASSLASANATPPTGSPPSPSPHHHLYHHHHHHYRGKLHSIFHPHHSPKNSHSKSPGSPKGFPQTLRAHNSTEDRPEHVGKKHIIHKHPHKHHEGDRKRWRSEVTQEERKRYEGVWAANKGSLIFMDKSDVRASGYPPDASEMVLNLVVRDIWSRSGLPLDLLERIWDLVDEQGIGLLTKEEFVVGMWLIDQALKGHKLPASVPKSVWDSVRFSPGIKLPS